MRKTGIAFAALFIASCSPEKGADGQNSNLLLSPFPPPPEESGLLIHGKGGGLRADDDSLEAMLSEALAECGASRFEWRELYNEPPSSLVEIYDVQPTTGLINCVAGKTRFDFYVITATHR